MPVKREALLAQRVGGWRPSWRGGRVLVGGDPVGGGAPARDTLTTFLLLLKGIEREKEKKKVFFLQEKIFFLSRTIAGGTSLLKPVNLSRAR